MTYANAKERDGLIAGLRDLADFLEGMPGIPAPKLAHLMVFPPTSSDDQMKAEIDSIAALIGSRVDDQTAAHRHYTTSRSFGPVEYQAVAIPTSTRAYHAARESYAGNIRPNADEEV
jgi:hypothetical protein